MEQNCPICRTFRHGILERLEVSERLIRVIRIDVDSARGTKLWRRWKRFCSLFGREATPVMMLGPYIFIPWKKREKPENISDAVLSTVDRFEYDLKTRIKELKSYTDVNYRSSYEMESLMSFNPDLEVYDEGVYIRA